MTADAAGDAATAAAAGDNNNEEEQEDDNNDANEDVAEGDDDDDDDAKDDDVGGDEDDDRDDKVEGGDRKRQRVVAAGRARVRAIAESSVPRSAAAGEGKNALSQLFRKACGSDVRKPTVAMKRLDNLDDAKACICRRCWHLSLIVGHRPIFAPSLSRSMRISTSVLARVW